MRAKKVKGGDGQALMLDVRMTPPVPTGTVAALGTAADGPIASWLAGLKTVAAAVAPSVPRLATVEPEPPNAYQ
jgi:hypothetical protein